MNSGLYDRAGLSATRQRRGVGEAVGGADDELVEGVAGIQLGAGPGVGRSRLRRRGSARPSTSRARPAGSSRSSSASARGAVSTTSSIVVRDAGEGLDGVGEQARGSWCGCVRPRRSSGRRACRVSSVQIEGVDTLEPGVPGGLGELGPNRGRDLRPQVICRWSAHADSPIVHSYVHTCGEAPARQRGRGYSWPGRYVAANSATARPRGSSRKAGANRSAGGAARYRARRTRASKRTRHLPAVHGRVGRRRRRWSGWIADVRDRAVHSADSTCARVL